MICSGCSPAPMNGFLYQHDSSAPRSFPQLDLCSNPWRINKNVLHKQYSGFHSGKYECKDCAENSAHGLACNWIITLKSVCPYTLHAKLHWSPKDLHHGSVPSSSQSE